MEDLLRQIYYNPSTGFSGVQKLYEAVKKVNSSITRSMVSSWLKQQTAYQVHQRIEKVKHFFPIKSDGPDHIWQLDLTDYSASAHHNSNVNYLFCALDIFTRKAYVIPLNNKNTSTITQAFEQMINESGNAPKIAQSDLGSEFTSRGFKALCKRHDILQSFSAVGDKNRMGIVERFNQTIRGMIEKFKTATKSKRYIDVLPLLVSNYNNRIHVSTASTPNDPDEHKIREIVEKKEELAAQENFAYDFDVGDQVRFVKNPVMFQKGSVAKLSAEIHTIIQKLGHRFQLDNSKWYKYYHLAPVLGNQQPPVSMALESTEPSIEPKKIRLANKKEGVNKSAIVSAEQSFNAVNNRPIRERRPQNQVLNRYGAVRF